ncbi:MAG TPA: ParB/RepB/Spo0J family partition protein [Terriglobia bacterium]|nr:ParB/RepB/Spo0J family partition protein [Terriglobia bacterium]
MPKKSGLPITVKMRHDFHYVDELSLRTGAPVGRMVPIDRLEVNPDQPRQMVGDLTDLIASITEKGVLEPILVRLDRVNSKFMIISGERRYRASLAAGLTEIPCIEKDVDDAEVAEIALIENLQRKDLTAFEEAEGLQSLIDRFGYTHEQIAERISKARSSVTETLSLNTIPPDVRQMCLDAQVNSKSMLLQVARQSSRVKMIELVHRFARGEVSRDEARQERLRGEKPRPRNYVFRFRPPTRDFSLEIKFSKTNVEREELIQTVSSILEALRAEKW